MISIIILSLTIVCLLFLAIEDWKDRRVSTFLLISLLGLLSFYAFNQKIPVKLIGIQSLINSFILLIEMGTLWLYCRYKNRSFSESFGLGDIIFLMLFIPFLSPHTYIFMILGSAVLGLLSQLLFKHKSGIPFISYSSILIVSYLLIYFYNFL